MPSSPASPAAASEVSPGRTLDPDERRARDASIAPAIVTHAVLLGVAADLLLRDGLPGLGLAIWLLLLALSALALVRRSERALPAEAGTWLAVAALLGAATAWRNADGLQFLDFMGMLFSLGMAAVALADARAALFADRLRDTVWQGVRVIVSVAAGILPVLLRVTVPPATGPRLHGRIRSVDRPLLIAIPLLVVFGALLRGADPVFASIVALPEIDLGTIASHVLIAGFFAWIVAGWARGALLDDPSRVRAPDALPFALGTADVSAALGTLNVLFALYVATQLGWFFGGERFLQARTGLTAAQYARQGFFQMVWVVVLVVPVLLVTRAALAPGRAPERRHTMLAVPLIALLGMMIVSAVLRMRLYVHYFGLTLDRYYPLVFMGWLAIVLAWLALTVLRGRGRLFAAGAVIAGLSILALLNIVVPDAVVARVNVARASRGTGYARPAIDLSHLASLGGEAVPIAVPAVLRSAPAEVSATDALVRERDRCGAAMGLLREWGPSRHELTRPDVQDATWRRWNAGAVEASTVVRANYRALLAVRHDACARARALSPAPGARPTGA